MNRNSNIINTFASIENQKRSKMDVHFEHLTTFNGGKAIPIAYFEVLPGHTYNLNLNTLVRGATPITATMDNAYLMVNAFFVPNRLTWKHWEEFMGENKTDYWEQKTEYQVPQIRITEPVTENDILNYFGIPVKTESADANDTINALPIRAYCKIWNDWYRDENLQSPCHLNDGDETTETKHITDDETYITTAETGTTLLPLNKRHDYFTSCLPDAQKGSPVALSLIDTENSIVADGRMLFNMFDVDNNEEFQSRLIGTSYSDLTNSNVFLFPLDDKHEGQSVDDTNYPTYAKGLKVNALATTINDLRFAFQLQRYKEKLALGGSRYIEIIAQMFGVQSADARLQRSEYLGGYEQPINITQVAQTSASNSTSPQGNIGAFSQTIGNQNGLINKSFTEHGYIIIIGGVRTEHKYSQGINKMLKRKTLFDFYFPVFANIGNVPVKNYEIFHDNENAEQNEQIFGYQEAWQEYRQKPNILTGYMNINSDTALSYYHYGDDYENLPTLSSEWIMETDKNIDRTLAVSSEISHQFIADFLFDGFQVIPMPTYSIPGLIDHN